MKTIKQLTAQDWIILRLLHYTLSTDVSSVMARDVDKTRSWALDKIGGETMMVAFEMIYQENRRRGEYNNPSCMSFRKMAREAEDAAARAKQYEPKDIVEFEPVIDGQWKVGKPKYGR